MKKHVFSFTLIVLLLTMLLSGTALAEGEQSFPYVLDNALLLSESERSALEQRAENLSEQHQCSVYIVTLQDYTAYAGDVYDCATGLYAYYDLGWGEGRDGVILLISMGDRDYALAGYGDLGQTVCNRESSYVLEDYFLDNFRDNDWYGGFSDYLDGCDRQLTRLESGENLSEGVEIITGSDGLDYHEYNDRGSDYAQTQRVIKLAVVIVVPLLAALIVCSIFKSQMKTAKEKTQADDYLVPQGVDLRIKQDRFNHRTEHREVIESDSGHRSGGGGSSFHSGGGFSGRSGKF